MEKSMRELNEAEVSAISGGETASQREAIGTGIMLAGLATADPIMIGLGALYLATN